MKTIKGQRLRSLLVHLDGKYFLYPPRNAGASTAMLAKQQGLVEIEGDLKSAFKCRLTAEGVKARALIKQSLKS